MKPWYQWLQCRRSQFRLSRGECLATEAARRENISRRRAPRWFAIAVALSIGFCTRPSPAQVTGAGPSKVAAPTASGTTGTETDAEKRAKIMASPLWKQVEVDYDKWIHEQVIYSREEMNRISAKVANELRTMPTDELEAFLADWDAKLKVLLDKNADDARRWLGVYLTNMTDGYRRMYLKQMGGTDIINMSADQLEDAIERVRAQRISSQEYKASYAANRQEVVQAAQQAKASDQQAREADDYQSQYSPIYVEAPRLYGSGFRRW